MSTLEPASKIRRSPQVAARELSAEEGAVLLHLETAQYHGINPVGLLIWELLDGERTVTDVVGYKRRYYGYPIRIDSLQT